MMLKIYAVYDQKAEAYMRPFFTGTRGLAIRSVVDLMNDKQSFAASHPEDFFLFELGTYDDSNGVVASKVVSLGCLLEFGSKGGA